MQQIASLAISGSREGGVRSETGAHVARTVPTDRQVWGSCREIDNSSYTLPSLPGGTCVEPETRTNVLVLTEETTESKRRGSI